MAQPIEPNTLSLSRGRSGVIAGLAAALTVLVLLPCFVPTTPVRYFESDPRIGLGVETQGRLTDLGPAAVAWLQGLTAVVAGLGLVAAMWAGAKLSKIAAVLAAVGMAAAVYHMTKSTARWEDWTQGGAWITAAMTGFAAMHLAQHEAGRRWIVGLCVAAALPLFAEAAWYVWVEHPVSVAFFETHRDELLMSRGMIPGSEPAALYERRLRFADATGTFGLSNVLASVAATIALAGIGIVLATRRRGRLSLTAGTYLAAGLSAATALLVVGLTASKGATVAVAATLGLAGVVVCAARFPKFQRAIPVVAVGVVALAFSAVLMRGAMGPPAPAAGGFVANVAIEGERSLLFRSHYWSAAARIAADHPVMGSGSRAFADLYPAEKNPLNPESVTSTHNVLVDQITMLGVGGWAWGGLLLWWLWRGARSAGVIGMKPHAHDESAGAAAEAGGVKRSAVWGAVGAAVVLFSVTLLVRQASLYLDSAVVWLVGIAGFVGVAAVLGSAGMVSSRAQRVSLLLAAAAALVHNQVEMAFFQPASMGLLWLIIGAAGAGMGACRPSPRAADEKTKSMGPHATTQVWRAWGGLVAAGGVALAVLIVMVVYANGATRHEQAMAGAEAALRRGDTTLTLSRLAEAQEAAGFDTRALRWRLQLHALEPMRVLLDAGRAEPAQRRVEEALAWIDDAIAAEDRPTTVARMRASLLGQWAALVQNEATFAAALTAYAALEKKSPYNIQDRLAWADLAWRAGDRSIATDRYAQVLELREQKYLDSADPLTAEQLTRVRQILADQVE